MNTNCQVTQNITLSSNQEIIDKIISELDNRVDCLGDIRKQAQDILRSFAKKYHHDYGVDENEFYKAFSYQVQTWIEREEMRKSCYLTFVDEDGLF